MKKKQTTKKAIKLSKETLRELTSKEAAAAGAAKGTGTIRTCCP